LDADQPFFLWVHFFDPHRPWEPSQEALALHPFPYDAEVWDTDRSTQALLDQLQKNGRLSNSLLVLTSDHGESLGEHGEWTHGAQVYDSTQRVPLVFWAGPETGLPLKAGHVATESVSLVDVAPTVAALLSVDFPATGVDLGGILRGERGIAKRDLLMESGYGTERYQAAPVFAVVRDENVWIDSPKPERYRLGDDPDQLNNRFDALADGPVLAELQSQYPRNPEGLREQKTLSLDQFEKLRALGYMAGSSASGAGEKLPTTDIKDRREMIALLQSGALGIAPQVALEKLAKWDREFGPVAAVDEMKVSLLDYLGQVEKADEWFEARKDTDEVVRADLERRRTLRTEKIALIGAMDQALLANPDHPTVRADLAITLWEVGKMEAARDHFDSALVLEPRNLGLRGDTVRFFIALGDLPKALLVLAQAEQPLFGELLCLRARVKNMMGEQGDLTDLRACQAQGGELGPTERALLLLHTQN
jgi:tetratricopeptide (TPR) repeat protein